MERSHGSCDSPEHYDTPFVRITRSVAEAEQLDPCGVQQHDQELYDLMLAEALEDEEGVTTFSEEFGDWSDTVEAAQSDLQRWDRAAMWERLLRTNPRLPVRTREFADRWYALATTASESSPTEFAAARSLIRERERSLKGARARLTYAEARDRRRGYPTTARLAFRWPQAQQIVIDILEALDPADA